MNGGERSEAGRGSKGKRTAERKKRQSGQLELQKLHKCSRTTERGEMRVECGHSGGLRCGWRTQSGIRDLSSVA